MLKRTLIILFYTLFAIPLLAQEGPAPLEPTETTFPLPLIEPGETVTGQVIDNISTQLYAFNATAGDEVTIEMIAQDTGLDPYLILLDARGRVLADNDDRAEGVRNSYLEAIEIPEDGTYVIFASTFQNLDEFMEVNPGQLLPYTLTVSGFTPPESTTDPTATLFATSIAPGTLVTGESTTEVPIAYIGLEATVGDVLDINMRLVEEGIDPVLHVFSPEGERIAFDDDDDTADSFTVDAAVLGLGIPEDGVYLIIATDTFFYNAGKEDVSLPYEPGPFELDVRPSVASEE